MTAVNVYYTALRPAHVSMTLRLVAETSRLGQRIVESEADHQSPWGAKFAAPVTTAGDVTIAKNVAWPGVTNGALDKARSAWPPARRKSIVVQRDNARSVSVPAALTPVRTGFAILATALLVCAGCTGGGSDATPSAAAASVQSSSRSASDNVATASRATKFIAVSDDENSAVLVFDPAGRTLAVLSDFDLPQGLANDVDGNLYVADEGNSRIRIYAAGFKGKPKTLADPGQYPIAVDTFANGKYVAVVNVNTTGNGPGSVIIYTNGVAGAPITNPAIGSGSFAAFDSGGNVYVDFFPAGGSCPCIGKIANATKGGRSLTLLTTANTITPYGIQITAAGQIAILDQSSNTIDTYDPPVRGSLGAPVARTPLGASLDAPAEFAFTSDMHELYVANNSDINSVFAFTYPGGRALSSISIGGLPFGVAIFPKAAPR